GLSSQAPPAQPLASAAADSTAQAQGHRPSNVAARTIRRLPLVPRQADFGWRIVRKRAAGGKMKSRASPGAGFMTSIRQKIFGVSILPVLNRLNHEAQSGLLVETRPLT